MKNIAIIGGGAAGMMAAIIAARNGNKVTIYEKNEKLGKKLFITGKGRCNITNASDIEELFAKVVTNSKFLYSAFYGFDNYMTMQFFEELGVKLKVERGNRVFPVSDHSSDVIRALEKELHHLKVEIQLRTIVSSLMVEENVINGILLENDVKVLADAVVVATGGISYPLTGSTGDGYRMAKSVNHHVVTTQPSLVPFEIQEDWCRELMGLSLRNIEIQIFQQSKKIYTDFGELLFTHFGVSGPTIISASAYIHSNLEKGPLELRIDLKPALTLEQLDLRIRKDFEANQQRQFKNSLDALLPKKLIPIVIQYSNIAPEKKVNEISKEERKQLEIILKGLPLTVTGLRNYNEAIITKGGVKVSEICPQTMESKYVKGLYFAGEVLDLDALTGGYNLQIAWSTGYWAGMSC